MALRQQKVQSSNKDKNVTNPAAELSFGSSQLDEPSCRNCEFKETRGLEASELDKSDLTNRWKLTIEYKIGRRIIWWPLCEPRRFDLVDELSNQSMVTLQSSRIKFDLEDEAHWRRQEELWQKVMVGIASGGEFKQWMPSAGVRSRGIRQDQLIERPIFNRKSLNTGSEDLWKYPFPPRTVSVKRSLPAASNESHLSGTQAAEFDSSSTDSDADEIPTYVLPRTRGTDTKRTSGGQRSDPVSSSTQAQPIASENLSAEPALTSTNQKKLSADIQRSRHISVSKTPSQTITESFFHLCVATHQRHDTQLFELDASKIQVEQDLVSKFFEAYYSVTKWMNCLLLSDFSEIHLVEFERLLDNTNQVFCSRRALPADHDLEYHFIRGHSRACLEQVLTYVLRSHARKYHLSCIPVLGRLLRSRARLPSYLDRIPRKVNRRIQSLAGTKGYGTRMGSDLALWRMLLALLVYLLPGLVFLLAWLIGNPRDLQTAFAPLTALAALFVAHLAVVVAVK